MVADGGRARRWGAYAALGIVIALPGKSAAADPPHKGYSASPVSAIAEKSPKSSASPSPSVAVEGATQRIATTLEAKNRYDQSPQGQKNAHDAAKAAHDAAKWAFWMVVVAAVETAVTAIGVLLVALTLGAARRSAREAKRSADEMKRSADATIDAAQAAADSVATGGRTAAIMEKTADRQLRAYVHITEMEMGFLQDGTHYFQITVENAGQTPAQWFETGGIAEVLTAEEIVGQEIPDDLPFNVWPALGGNRQKTVLLNCGDSRATLRPFPNDGSRNISVRGRVRYQDIAGIYYETEFSFYKSADVAGKMSHAPGKYRVYRRAEKQASLSKLYGDHQNN